MTDPERKNAANTRAGFYSLLSTLLLREVTSEVVEHLRRGEVAAALQPFGVDFGTELEALEADLGREGMLEELACEYARLFIGPGPHIGPYESLHREDAEQRTLWGPAAAEVKRFIEQHGLSLSDDSTGIPDHISVEFDFLARLSREEVDALDAGDQERADLARRSRLNFFRDHVRQWVPAFCAQVEEQAKFAFYRDVARLCRAMVEVETEELERTPVES